MTHRLIDMAELARLEEARVARAAADMAPEHRPFAGGVLGRGHPGSWFNTAYGAGLSGRVEADEMDAAVAWHAAAGIEPRVELCTFAHESLVRHLADRGFVARQFEIVSFRMLAPGERVDTPQPPPAELEILPVDPEDAGEVDEYARVALSGFLPPGMEAPEELLEASRNVTRHPRTVAVRAVMRGRCVGAGAMEVAGDVAALFGVTVLEQFRRRGVQQALVAWRLNEAAARGARFATICSRPGVATDRNARRMGFEVGYTRVVVVRPGEGLAPVVE